MSVTDFGTKGRWFDSGSRQFFGMNYFQVNNNLNISYAHMEVPYIALMFLVKIESICIHVTRLIGRVNKGKQHNV